MAKKKKRSRPGEGPSVSIPDRRPLPPVVRWLTWLGAALTFWSFGFTMMRGSDLWWHIASGRWMIEHGEIPKTDSFSYTALGEQWVVDAWLSDLIYALWSRAFGMASLVWWKWGIIVAAFLLLFHVAVKLSKGRLGGPYAASLFGAAIAAPFLDIRPNLVSLLAFTILLALSVGRERVSWGIVPLFLIWVNLHAGFTLGLLALPFLLGPSLLDRRERKRAAILFGASVVVCLINPNGIGAFTQPILYALQSDSPFQTIGEWRPPFRPGGIRSALFPFGIAAFAVGLIVYLSADRSKPRPLPPWNLVLFGAVTLAMSLTSRRFIPFFAVTQALTLAPLLARFRFERKPLLPRWSIAAASIAIGGVLLVPYPLSSRAFPYMTAEYTFPVDTMNFIEANRLSGRLFAYFNWGGYVHLHTGGRLKVFIDGRASALFEDETYVRYVAALSGGENALSIVEQSEPEFILWPRNEPRLLQRIAESQSWRPLYFDSVSVLFVRRDRPLGAIQPPADSPYHDLTRAMIAYDRKDLVTAEQALQQARARRPDLRSPCDSLVRLYRATGRHVLADETSDQCLSIFPMEGRWQWYRKLFG